MSEQLQYQPSFENNKLDDEHGWIPVEIDEEKFLVKKGFTPDIKYKDGNKIDLASDIYKHPETGMEIVVHSVGMTKPIEQPALIRADYACPCMTYPSSFNWEPNHDCKQQRDMMFETIAELGNIPCIIATISEETAAGNGHGQAAVYEESDIQRKAKDNGKPAPTREEALSHMGYFNDARRHDIVAKVIKVKLGDRAGIPTTASLNKLQHFENSGITLVPETRVELITQLEINTKRSIRRTGLNHSDSIVTPGAYLLTGNSYERLTRESYMRNFGPKSTQQMVN